MYGLDMKSVRFWDDEGALGRATGMVRSVVGGGSVGIGFVVGVVRGGGVRSRF